MVKKFNREIGSFIKRMARLSRKQVLQTLLFRLQNHVFSLAVAVIFFFFFFVTVWGENGILKLVELKHIREKVSYENESILKQNLVYLQEIESLKKTPFVEQRARSDLGFVRTNEKVFILTEPVETNQ